MSSRETILRRIRQALNDVPLTEVPRDVAVDRSYLRRHGERSPGQSAELLAGNLADYRALVHRCTDAELPSRIASLLTARGSRTVVAPAGVPARWLADSTGVERVPEGSGAQRLDTVDTVVTGCAVAIAETGTVVLDAAPDQGRRRITLVPDHHICVVRVPEQVVDSVPEALERLSPQRPLTWISGPSATSDIELDRVEGVHGPRTLEVVLVTA